MAKRFRGDFLSAMIQTSYNQGFNNFKFGEVDAGFFGNSLEGKEGNTLIIDVGKIVGEGALCDANNCSLTARLVRGERCLAYAQKCAITTDTLHGIWAFQDAKHCVATIQKYDGSHFGQWMENCKIYSRNKAVLDRLIAQTHTYKDNSFTFLSSD
ncbi:hypothetical protein HY643_01895 [Candidatus Woesearchaeota archaeon]|nr:hypothetical protein [Candidatus Woesearchaeota archaeon]